MKIRSPAAPARLASRGSHVCCAAAALLAVLAMTAADAQTVWRCGNSYGDTPCANARVVDATDARSTAQLEAAREVLQRDRRLAAELQHERRLQQAALQPLRAASLSGTPPAAAASQPARPRPRKRHRYAALPDDDFIAVAPASLRKARKAGAP